VQAICRNHHVAAFFGRFKDSQSGRFFEAKRREACIIIDGVGGEEGFDLSEELTTGFAPSARQKSS
jgi:hypothetical protein